MLKLETIGEAPKALLHDRTARLARDSPPRVASPRRLPELQSTGYVLRRMP
jgi:hypothetical protein